MPGLKVSRKDSETWRECVCRYAAVYGLQHECLQIFDRLTQLEGRDEGEAAWAALYEWDLLELT